MIRANKLTQLEGPQKVGEVGEFGESGDSAEISHVVDEMLSVNKLTQLEGSKKLVNSTNLAKVAILAKFRQG